MDQAAAFQKLWLDTFGNVANVWSQFSPGSPPPEEMRRVRGGMLKAMAGAWDEFTRTPQFMEMMKASLNGALDLRRMGREGMNKMHEQFETPSKEDLDSILLAIRHVERRLLDRVEGVGDRVLNISEQLEKLDERLGKMDERIEKLSPGADRPPAAPRKTKAK